MTCLSVQNSPPGDHFFDGETLSNPQHGRAALLENDALPALEESDAVIETGPTGTNVNDLRVFVIEA
ncbi:MOFRL family protein [Halorhabdus utahensis]|uniref:MOFRL family protein n=1 Tax=Halorhabdus utahensis TaxID=146826 RepID=UPI00019BB539